MILAQALAGWSFAQLAIAVVIVAAVIALVFIAVRQFGVQIPAWVVQVFWVLVVAVVIIFAIRFVMTL